MTEPGLRLAYLGPEGTFTHEAALGWARSLAADPESPSIDLVPLRTVADVYAQVASGEVSHGVVAIENSVEGYVVPSLDAIVAAQDVVAIDEAFVTITFDAFALPDDGGPFMQVSSHPHGLAQCQDFIAERSLVTVPATSNAAACRDIEPGQLALGPRICGEIYGLRTHTRSVEDFRGARTRFLLLTSRTGAVEAGAAGLAASTGLATSTGTSAIWRTMVAITPHITGPGVLARITEAFGSLGVNMSSLITRPLKALEARYVFIVTVDGAPWDAPVRSVLEGLLTAGDSVKTLGVFPSRGELDETVEVHRVPAGSVQAGADESALRRGLLWA
ncbi:prephenate dehydratase/chorismate mutase / prephenate dehydratase [Sanguibacter gelidistatuariae]|uniref:Prephenate dehydratase n=1 Tax=Sanguibacter gelidistatuariae TaxID=1814289 RepID=A0A1G6ME66_9MICO|nr:prephenate dehydratase domain-containing protein [Sanguibacter gelidistatuariae]SDC53862.1 prephenate dehydratase/chorismate mutase / prephenate dehydratase [Sanguibacter gelidistatuariae]